MTARLAEAKRPAPKPEPVASVGAVVRVPRESIRPFPGQPRSYFDPLALKELARSLKAIGQQVPLTVRPLPSGGYELVDGQRRWLAAKDAGLTHLTAWVRTDLDDVWDQFTASVVANFSREGHTHIEIADAVARIRKNPDVAGRPKGEQTDHIAEMFGRSTAWVLQHENLLGLAPQVQALLHPSVPEKKRLTFEAAQLLTALPAADQTELATYIVKHRLRAAAAKRLIRERLHALDGRPIDAGPSRYTWEKVVGLLGRMTCDLDVLLAVSMKDFRDAAGKRDQLERLRLSQAAGQGIEMLRGIQQALARVDRERGA